MTPEMLNQIRDILLPEGSGKRITINRSGMYFCEARGLRSVTVRKNGQAFLTATDQYDVYIEVKGFLKGEFGDVISTDSSDDTLIIGEV